MLAFRTNHSVMPTQAGTHASLREDGEGGYSSRDPRTGRSRFAMALIHLCQEHMLRLAWVPTFVEMTLRAVRGGAAR
jgi:hypothetical protein